MLAEDLGAELAGSEGHVAGFNSRDMKRLSYCKIDVYLGAEMLSLCGHEKPRAKRNAADFESILGACR